MSIETQKEDLQEKERSELSTLLDQGVAFTVSRRKFIIKQPYYGTLDRLANIFINMPIDPDFLTKGGVWEIKQYAAKYPKLCAEVVAIAVLRSKWRIRLFKRPLTSFFYWNVTPAQMHKIVLSLNTMLNLQDFTHSIMLMSGTRITMPDMIEGNIKA